MSWFRSRRGAVALLGSVLLILFGIRPSVGPLRARIARSISISLGRQVDISSASLRLLPQPGFVLENFVVRDDPAFSLEPVLRSDEVTASLRITSLLRGHLEIARLTLADPSLNLVRNQEGHWNLEYLLERAARIPVAPTGKPAGETRPGFPYIEASGGRINFKFGMEKKQFALTEADFSIFQDSENSWGVRMKARPIRTDSNFSDTGFLKITGSWQRAQSLHETPLRFSMQWEQAQLGQASKLIYGNDKGWRGAAALSAELSGTADNLAILAEGSVEDFRRYDILGRSPMRLRAQCGGYYSSSTQSVSKIICEAPVGDGAITLHGTMTVSQPLTYHLAVFAQDAPIQALIALARHSKKDIPDDLAATGALNGTIKIEKASDKTPSWEGSGETTEFRLASQLAPSQISLPGVHFVISSATHDDEDVTKGGRATRQRARRSVETLPRETRVDITPFAVGLGEPAPVTLSGWFSRSGYGLAIEGDARLQQLLRASRAMGIPTPQFDADGKVILGLQIADTWAGFKAPRVTGNAELHSVRGKIRGLNTTIEIGAAKVILNPEEVTVQSLTASAGGTTWHGSLVLPRPCGLMGTCPIQMDLHADEIATDRVAKILGAQDAQRPWYGFLMTSRKSPYLLGLRATGHLAADRVIVHKLAGTDVSANFDLERGRLRLKNLRGTVFGGTQSGEWTLDFTVRPPAYSGEGSFEHVSLAQLATAMHDNWIAGTAAATYHVTASGWSAGELFSSATGILQIEARDGIMPHMLSPNFAGPLQFRHFAGGLVLRHNELDFMESRLTANGGVYDVTGTASLGRSIDLKLLRSGNRGFSITGTLSAPVVSTSAVPATQAALKP